MERFPCLDMILIQGGYTYGYHKLCKWIKLYYVEEGTQLPYEVARLEFNVHGEAPTGANEGPVHAEAAGVVTASFKKSGRLIATSYCNIHGLWESEKDIVVEG